MFVSMGSAAQIQGFASGYAPGKVDVKKKVKGQESDLDFDSDLVWGLGAEFLVNPVGPLYVGGGLGFISEQKDGDASLVMPAVPVFGSIGVIGPQKWPVRPYLGARVGYPVPASQDKSWWRKPLNFVVTGNVGAQLPYHMGLEFDCTYLTMYKYFDAQDMGFRTNSLKFGGSLTVHFDLFGGNSGKPDEKPEEKPAAPADTAAPAVEETPASESAPASETVADSATAEAPVAESVDQPVAEPVEEPAAAEPVAEEPAAEPLQDDFETAAAATEPVEGTPAEETPAEESAEAAAEPAEAETAAEAAEEPAEEPAVEAAPEPEKKAVKKSAKKSKAKKKPAKKSKKKPAKKSKGKKKK